MSQGQLKKEFTKKDVTRMRNIITGNTGDRTQVLSGYEKSTKQYKEGDIWEDSGRSWTIKNGIKQTITKQDKLKKLVILPIACPNCKKHMKTNELNKKMYSIHNTCFDCVIEKEQKIKIAGNWDEYVSQNTTANKNSELQDFEQALDSWMNEKQDFFTESGELESWSSGGKTKAYEEIKSKIEEMKNLKL